VPLLDSGVTKFNKRCISLGRASSGRQVIHFADHTTYEADLVIGADGIKSIVRNAVVSDGHLVFSNTYAYRGLIPMDTLKSAGLKADVQSCPHNWVGLGGVCTSLLGDFEPKLIFDPIKAHNNIFSQRRYRRTCLT
jgi:salicylate hydroxylase